MKLSSKHLFIAKILLLLLLSLSGAWLLLKTLYFSAALLLLSAGALSVSLYYDRRKLIEKMSRMITSIRHSDFSCSFTDNSPKDELSRLYCDMNEALEIFRIRTHKTLIEETETEAWQKLISVLTHEIMNSIAPIISLSETLHERELTKNNDPEEYGIMKQAMETIHRRSKGLLSFVENYRKLTRIPQPLLQPIELLSTLKSLQQLVAPEGIRFSCSVYPEKLLLNADRGMLEQILINLLKNAKEATESKTAPKIAINVRQAGNETRIEITDNGQGISPEAIEKIFIPFYTTKPNGSGIGLSITRQMMLRHKGKISVKSNENGSCFTLHFPK